jgi:hypothetical protein
MTDKTTWASESGQSALESLGMLVGLAYPFVIILKLVGLVGWSWWVVGPLPIWAVLASVVLSILGDILKFLLGLGSPRPTGPDLS